MSEEIKVSRLGKAAKEFNVSTATIVEFLSKKGFTIEDSINTKLTVDMYQLLMVEYQREKQVREEALKIEIGILRHAAEEAKHVEEKLEKQVEKTVEQAIEKPKVQSVPKAEKVEKVEKIEKKSSEKPKKEVVKEVVKEKKEIKIKKVEKETVKEEKPVEIAEIIEIPKELPKEEPKETVKEAVKEVNEIKKSVKEDVKEEIVLEIPKDEKREEEIKVEKTTEKQEDEHLQEEEHSSELEEHTKTLKTKVIGKLDLDSLNTKTRPDKKSKSEKRKEIAEREKAKEQEKNKIKEQKELSEKEQQAKEQAKERRREKDRERKKRKKLELANLRLEKQKEDERTAKLMLEQIRKEAVKVKEKPEPPIKKEPEMIKTEVPTLKAPKVLGQVDLSSINERIKPKKKSKEQLRKEKNERIRKEREERKAQRDARRNSQRERDKDKPATDKDQKFDKNKKPERGNNFIPTRVDKLSGLKVVDKISIPSDRKDGKPGDANSDDRKEKRQRFKTTTTNSKFTGGNDQKGNFGKNKKEFRKDTERRATISGEEVDKQIKKTMARMAPTGKTKSSKYRREKRDLIHQNFEQAQERQAQEQNILKVTEFITASELATMMNVPVNKVIATCMSVGLMVAINQRLDTDNIKLLAEEFGFQVQFVGVEDEENKQEEEVNPEDLEHRAPIVTIMGHVDHGKTSLLDYIRKTNVIAGEAGGITQHIGAYEVELPDKRRITFLDTPGHEAFTAMRARGAKVTDIVIVVIAADDSIMPQTVEAINHAHAAGVPIIFAINKIDKPGADPEKIRNALANMNLLVEEWGGKIQSQDISAKKGINVDILMEKILIEAEMLELKANPKIAASGTIIESSLDKGRGYVAKALIQNGTLYKGDVVVAGTSFGKIKAMYNERNHLLTSAGPASPVLLLGLDSAPQAGDTFKVYESEKEAKSIVGKRQQLIREQGLRTQKHITLTEIGRRIAIGDFKELNIIVKGDVDGSIEALSDSLLRLTTEEVQVNVIHKSVGQVTESDILLASASNAIIIAFQVRPSAGARKLAEQEQIDIRTYSIIYDAINDLKEAIEGMKAPEIKENIVCNIEVREVFRITKVGVIAGCYVLDGKVQRSTQIRVIRDGIVVFTGRLGSLKRFKDDVKEVTANYECGLNIESYNDIKVGDIIEGFEQVAVKK